MWSAQLHGATDGMSPEDAKSWEHKLVDRLHGIAAELAPAGHTGVLATFHGDHVGAVNLTDARQEPEGTPAPDEGVKADGTPHEPPDEPPPTFPTDDETATESAQETPQGTTGPDTHEPAG